MQEVRIDLRTQNFERKNESIRSNQLCFKINNTMPNTPECDNLIKELFPSQSCQSNTYRESRIDNV